MINHARTLLLNVPGPHDEDVYTPGDVYIPAFAAQALPANLQLIASILFGAAPDYEGRLYRTAQYMSILHSTEYAAYIYDLDSRITYSPDEMTIVDEGLYLNTVSDPSAITISGSWADAGSTGRVVTRWRISTSDINTFYVENITEGKSATYAAGQTKYLVGSDYVFSTTIQPTPAGLSWSVTNKSRPTPDVGVIVATLKTLPEKTLAAIFGATPRKKPYDTFYNLFTQHYALPYQLSGLLLAYIYTLEGYRE